MFYELYSKCILKKQGARMKHIIIALFLGVAVVLLTSCTTPSGNNDTSSSSFFLNTSWSDVKPIKAEAIYPMNVPDQPIKYDNNQRFNRSF